MQTEDDLQNEFPIAKRSMTVLDLLNNPDIGKGRLLVLCLHANSSFGRSVVGTEIINRKYPNYALFLQGGITAAELFFRDDVSEGNAIVSAINSFDDVFIVCEPTELTNIMYFVKMITAEDNIVGTGGIDKILERIEEFQNRTE